MSTAIPCRHCLKGHHYSHKQRLICQRNSLSDRHRASLESRQVNESSKEDDDITDLQQLSNQLEQTYSDMENSRKQYYSFYNDYRRNGVSDADTYQPISDQGNKNSSNLGDMANIFQELLKFKKLDDEKKTIGKIGNKKALVNCDLEGQEKRLKRYLREHSQQLLTFEDLVIKDFLTDWNKEEKLQKIGDKDWTQSDARSRRRQIRGKDRQSMKNRYGLAWRILTDPFTRLMLSDRFMEQWHERMFPKYLNPYKFRRLEKELKNNIFFYEKAKDQLSGGSMQTNEPINIESQYLNLSQQFKELSKQLIQLKVNVFPPSFTKSVSTLVEQKQECLRKVEDDLLELCYPQKRYKEHNCEDNEVIQQSWRAYYQREREKREAQRVMLVEERRASVREKKWLSSAYLKHPLIYSIIKYGTQLGPSVSISQEGAHDLLKVIKLQRQIRSLKKRCQSQLISLEQIQDLEFEYFDRPTLHSRKLVRRLLQKKLENESSRVNSTQKSGPKFSKYYEMKAKTKPIEKRTLFHIQTNFIMQRPSSQPISDLITEVPPKLSSLEVVLPQKRPTRQAKLRCLSLLNQPKLSKKDPLCPQCKEKGSMYPLLWQKQRVYCTQCTFSQGKTSQLKAEKLLGETLRVVTDGLPYNLKVFLPPPQSSSNNVKAKVGPSYAFNNSYLTSCPSSLTCSYSDFQPISKEINRFKRNIHLFPFQVRPSIIPNAGQGLFTTAKLRPQTLVGVYTGAIGTHIDTQSQSDSLFQLGWFEGELGWTPLLLDGKIFNEGSRFVNSKHGDSQTNVKAIIGVHQSQLTILYITHKVVEPNQELFVDYGKNYDLSLIV